MTFKLNQQVMTSNGPAMFIGYIDHGVNVQVSRMVPASSMTKSDCIKRKPNVVDMSQIDFLNWQKSAKFCINETYALSEISQANKSSKAKSDDYAQHPESETSTVAAGMPVTVRDIPSDSPE